MCSSDPVKKEDLLYLVSVKIDHCTLAEFLQDVGHIDIWY